ncbi:MAG: acyltransferase [archaeon]
MPNIFQKIKTIVNPSVESAICVSTKLIEKKEKLDFSKIEFSFHADLIRCVAMLMVVLLHSAVEPYPIPAVVDQSVAIRWWTINIYDALSEAGVPLFVMVSGALLLQPSKIEPTKVFLKKRLKRIAPAFVFWSAIYFIWRATVQNEALSVTSIIHYLETSPYYHFWFIYMIFGLYLISPLLRSLIANSDRDLIKYGLILWFVGTAIVPIIGIFDYRILENRIFMSAEWAGYFILGYYLLKTKIKPRYIYTALFGGLSVTIIGTYVIRLLTTGKGYFFLNTTSANMIVVSVSLFLLLQTVPAIKTKNRFPKFAKLVHALGKNTLPIYMMHVIVLETFQKGYLGIQISLNTLNPIWQIPFLAVLTLFTCLAITLAVKKIPILQKIVG